MTCVSQGVVFFPNFHWFSFQASMIFYLYYYTYGILKSTYGKPRIYFMASAGSNPIGRVSYLPSKKKKKKKKNFYGFFNYIYDESSTSSIVRDMY
jgi:hypothetical protein